MGAIFDTFEEGERPKEEEMEETTVAKRKSASLCKALSLPLPPPLPSFHFFFWFPPPSSFLSLIEGGRSEGFLFCQPKTLPEWKENGRFFRAGFRNDYGSK